MISIGKIPFLYSIYVLTWLFQGCEIQAETDQGVDVEANQQKPSLKRPLQLQSLTFVPAILLNCLWPSIFLSLCYVTPTLFVEPDTFLNLEQIFAQMEWFAKEYCELVNRA